MDHLQERADQQLHYFERFDRNIRHYLRTILSDELIEEHRISPLGRHSDALERVLNYFRRPPHFGLYADKSGSLRMIHLPVIPGEGPQFVSETLYQNKEEGAHAVFLAHVDLLCKGDE
jgi:branched-chain amino acid transport system permease protein